MEEILKKDEEKEKGHRKRLREKFLTVGTKGLQDYEILELLLTYTIVRKNCRRIAFEIWRFVFYFEAI